MRGETFLGGMLWGIPENLLEHNTQDHRTAQKKVTLYTIECEQKRSCWHCLDRNKSCQMNKKSIMCEIAMNQKPASRQSVSDCIDGA